MPKHPFAGKQTPTNTISFEPPLTRATKKRKIELGEDVQLYDMIEAERIISNTRRSNITKFGKFDMKALISRYKDEGIEDLIKEGLSGHDAEVYMMQEAKAGGDSFTMFEASGASTSRNAALKSLQKPDVVEPDSGGLDLSRRKKQKIMRPGEYVIDGILQTPKPSDSWQPVLHKPEYNESHRPPRTSNTSDKPARRSRNKKRGGWRVREDLSRKDKDALRHLHHADFHQNAVFSLKEDTLVTEPGWNGQEPLPASKGMLIQMWHDKKLGSELKKFYKVHITDFKSITILMDCNNLTFLVRSDQTEWFKNTLGPKFVEVCDLLTVNTNYKSIILPDTRGEHDPVIIGIQRQHSKEPNVPKFEKDNILAVTSFKESEITKQVCQHIVNILKARFPGVAARYARCAIWHWRKYGKWPEYGLYFNFCLNVPRPEVGRVHCAPHVDSKNIVGVCAVLVYELPNSNFNHKERSWLVLWDAGVMVEIAPWMVVFYPSSLFYHFNIDPCDFEVVSAPEGETPTQNNSKDLNGAHGRGSMVFFNQATLFMSSETDSQTLNQAEKNGKSRKTDFSKDINACFKESARVFSIPH
ncbi:hypothetical protein BDN72DRAFT_864624 [Pluteus cervinus]|uniref:Uncharacterized protein n=1 Tax=Pluteus cervinus TaxID=181527 RepID=A0ACD3A3J1_9AGAR|nr:hypothetical protein BDN72DRAFT_864624 [Pluteus cervinus]